MWKPKFLTSLSHVGLYLRKRVFGHEQLYVVVSRVTSREGLKILVCEMKLIAMVFPLLIRGRYGIYYQNHQYFYLTKIFGMAKLRTDIVPHFRYTEPKFGTSYFMLLYQELQVVKD